MTEPTLQASDAEPRWVGVRREYVVAALVLGALGIDRVFSKPWNGVLVLLATLVGLAVTPLSAHTSIGREVGALFRYALRSRWFVLRVKRQGSTLRLAHRSSVDLRLFRFPQVGRLDLAGQDHELTALLRKVSGTLALGSARSHLGQFVVSSDQGVSTFLALRGSADVGSLVAADQVPLLRCDEGVRVIREGWRSLDCLDASVAVLRVARFANTGQRPLLEILQRIGGHSTLCLQAAVVPTPQARRMTGRAVHRSGVDDAARGAMGFRHSINQEMNKRRLQRREQLVVSGEALLQLAVYLVIEAASQRELRDRVAAALQQAREVGLTLERGHGRQAQWFRWALPGGVEW